MREFSLGLLLSAVLALPVAAAEAPAVWDAHIAVTSQQGATCRHEPAVPHERRFVVIGDPGSATPLVASDEGEGLRLVLESPKSHASPTVAVRYTLQGLTEGGARRGSLLLVPAGEGFAGRWQEVAPEPGQPGCAWTEARIVLHPPTDTDPGAARIALLTQAFDIAARQTSRAADAGVWPAADLAEFARLGPALARAATLDARHPCTSTLDRAATLNNLADALLLGGHRNDARTAFERALAQLSRSEPAHLALIEIIESAQAAITAQPESDPATPPNAPRLRGTAHIS